MIRPLCAALVALGAGAAAAGDITFRSALDNRPIEFGYMPDHEITPAVARFRETGENPCAGQEEALEAGRKLYRQCCQACHPPDGTGRIGPDLTDEQ